MAVTVVNIYNMALTHLGVSTFVTAVGDGSKEDSVLSLWYSTVRDALLQEIPWGFATRRKALTENTDIDPPDVWGYCYGYPTDCLKARAIVGTARVPITSTRIPYEVATDTHTVGETTTTYKLIYTDQEDAELIYTVQITDPAFFDPLFAQALSYRLAASAAMALTGKADMMLRMNQAASIAVSQAAAFAFNEGFDDEPDGELLNSRL